jgi:RimJ/RimL family protein N-acetyltransferase/uncharacterized NAD(P)/FAD-binding protein YdhS
MHTSIAIMGFGPRGLSVLERLCAAPGAAAGDGMTIHLVDPKLPGPGVHGPEQPHHLLLNTIAGQITMFRGGDRAADGRPLSGPSLAEWAGVADEVYLSRAALGRYLAYCYGRIRAAAPDSISIREHRVFAERIRALRGDSWVLHLSDGSQLVVNAVVLAVGHGSNRPGPEDEKLEQRVAQLRRTNPRLHYVRTCYPLDRLDVIAPGACVALRGMGLSAIDVVSCLTVGRGGRFVRAGAQAGDHGDVSEGELTYLPSGAEPRIYVYSRTGRVFWPRAVNQKTPADAYQPRHLTRDAVDALRAAHGQLDFEEHLLPLMRDDLLAAAKAAGSPEGSQEGSPGAGSSAPGALADVARLLDPPQIGPSRSLEDYQAELVGFLAADERRAAEGNLTNPVKTATDALRDIREELRRAVEYAGLTPKSHKQFVDVYAPLLNAMTGGPPASRSEEWRALFAARVLHVGAGPAGRARLDTDQAAFVLDSAHQTSPPTRCDVLVNASVERCEPERDASPLIRSLLAAGLVRPFSNGPLRPGGLDVDPAGRLIGASGRPSPTLFAVGHPTEGPRYYTNMLPAPGTDSRITADAAALVAALTDTLFRPAATEAVEATETAEVAEAVEVTVHATSLRERSTRMNAVTQLTAPAAQPAAGASAAWIAPFTVAGEHVSLIPLDRDHEAELVEAVEDGRVWDTWFASVPKPGDMRKNIEWRLECAAQGTMVPFTVLDPVGRVAGMTAYMSVDPKNRRLEIGYTWYRKSVQRTRLNTQAKLFLLTHAFEQADCIAVGFRTSSFNAPSRRAIERLGAKLDGVLRNHLILPDGTLRDTCYYSVLPNEWPAVKRHLTWLLERGNAEAA